MAKISLVVDVKGLNIPANNHFHIKACTFRSRDMGLSNSFGAMSARHSKRKKCAPSNVDKYFSDVRHEFHTLPNVFVAKSKPTPVIISRNIAKYDFKCYSPIQIAVECKSKWSEDFLKMRSLIQDKKQFFKHHDRFPMSSFHGFKKTEESGVAFMFGKSNSELLELLSFRDSQLIKENEELPFDNNFPNWRVPSVTLMAGLTQDEIVFLLQINQKLIVQYAFHHVVACWFYSLLATLEIPPHGDVTADLRTVALSVIAYRYSLSVDVADPSKILSCDLLVFLIARFYQQQDLIV